MKPVVSAFNAWSCTVLSVFAIVILSALAGLYRSNHEEFTGGVDDPEDGKAVSDTIFIAVLVYVLYGQKRRSARDDDQDDAYTVHKHAINLIDIGFFEQEWWILPHHSLQFNDIATDQELEKDIPVSHQDFPGTEREMPNPKATRDELPEAGGNSRTYQGSGKLKGKKALITGGDSGIGAASALLFGREGVSDIVIAYLPEEEKDAQDTKKQVENEGAKVHLISLDLSKKENCKKLVEFAVEKMNGIDILFNNAAYQMMVQDIKDLPEEQWIHTFKINIHSFFYISKYSLPHMKAGATIINNASINAYIGRPDLLDYTSTKGAIVSFTRGLSNQYVSKGIRVNAVAPGPVWTPLIPATMDDEAQKQFTSPMGRPAQPSEIATCVVFLASSDSSCVSGQTIHCNGGTVVNG
ncbi:short-chain alcohol dehydrogenase [Fusarium circinatum]|uniref:Short-chain alcohol dehydrogenase n=1 Tax=Fusarium circinatum TaxID=48490 RepID=A0A8H5TF92_FUSCI|nr:short-chain alcohol dehydrogenase [Fusarium circinatum]